MWQFTDLHEKCFFLGKTTLPHFKNVLSTAEKSINLQCAEVEADSV